MRSVVHSSHETPRGVGGATDLGGGQHAREAHHRPALVNTLPTAKYTPTPTPRSPSADLPPGHAACDTQGTAAGGDLPADHRRNGIHPTLVGGNTLPAANPRTSPNGPPPLATHDALLLILADALDDLERTRISTQNRLRSLGQVKGLTDSREAGTMHLIADTLGELEHKATLDLQRAMRAHPLGPWVKRTVGIGEKQGARLIAAIGNPADRKMPSQLWQYCGHGAPSKRARGVKTFWNPTAKMRLHLIAESCMKQRTSPYRAIYDEARMDWADRTECPTCKNGCSDGHKHNHALRMVGKQILLDLWLEAKALA